MRTRRPGYNMVEVLVALVVVGIITTTMFAFVNDYHQRYRVTVARGDLNRIAEAIQLAEQRTGQRITQLSAAGGGLTTPLAPYLVELRDADPWGNRFKLLKDPISHQATFVATAGGDPYVIDVGLGRIICAGPDGRIDSLPGRDPPDTENDILVDYRRRPWLAYVLQGHVYLSTTDGATRHRVTSETCANLALSPDGTWFAGIRGGNSLVVGAVDEANPALRTVVPRPGFTGGISQGTYPLFYPSGTSIMFFSNLDLYRYDIGLDRIIPLTTSGFFGPGDSTSGERSFYTNGRVSCYGFTDTSQIRRSLTVGVDGKLAFSRGVDSQAGIFVVSAAGGDVKMIKRCTDTEKYLPVFWLDADTLVYRNAISPITFYRMRQDGSYDIALHRWPVSGDPKIPTLSTDGAYFVFFLTDNTGAVLRSDGSGFVVESEQRCMPFTVSGGILTAVPPVWLKKSPAFYFVSNNADGRKVLKLDLTRTLEYYPPSYSIDEHPTNELGLAGLRPVACELSGDETLTAVLSSAAAGLFVVPLLGPNGAQFAVHAEALGANDLAAVRWIDQR